MLGLDWCRTRQQRLLRLMAERGVNCVVTQNPFSVHYFTGALVEAQWPQAFLMDDSGRTLLVTNKEPVQSASDSTHVYSGYTLQHPFGRLTMHEELGRACREFIKPEWRAGVEQEHCTLHGIGSGVTSISADLIAMRRKKDPDELDAIRAVIALTQAGYAAVRAGLAPGMTENDVYTLMHGAMVKHLGTSVDLRGDFACGTRAINGGGPPTARVVEEGDLYILDIFPALDGYRCDLCRTFCAGKPSQLQQDAWAHVLEAHECARQHLRPGGSARAAYEHVRAHLDRFEPARGSFTHHAGHGVGMEAWEYPWLIPGSDQTSVEGEVVAFEPGLYTTELRGGIRLEHNYLITADGPVALDDFPMDLV